MALYDQNQNANPTPWYAPQPQPQYRPYPNTAVPTMSTQPQTPVNQFVWVNGPGTVDMWPVAAGSEMTFIDNENMVLYVKRVDEFNHPLKVRRFKLTEITDEMDVKPVAQIQAPQIDMDKIHEFINTEVQKQVNDRLQALFGNVNSTEESHA